MKLVYARPSPFVRKVMVLLEEAGAASSVELIDGFGSPVAPSEDAVAANPLGKIPCLVLDSGQSMYDSRVITRYLDDHFQTGLYPAGGPLWDTLTLEAHADGILDAAVLTVYETRCRDDSARSSNWTDAQRGKISRALDAIEANWLIHLNGAFDMTHISVGCVLGYLDFRAGMGGWPDWRDGHPGLRDWGEPFLERASMVATRPE
ncbi:MAG: glutathione S-transferase [Thiotrichales bacterium]|nr:glutathione S-transferase [Thiotrichales bacterium]